jgi:hypothetical protein
MLSIFPYFLTGLPLAQLHSLRDDTSKNFQNL